MTYEMQVRSRQENLPEMANPFGPLSVENATPDGIFIKIHRLLRGRYLWAFSLAIILGGAGAFLGFKSRKPIYIASGYIHIKPFVETLMGENRRDNVSYNTFRQLQVSLLTQQRIIDMALASDEWNALGRKGSNEDIYRDFLDSFNAVAPINNENIIVSFADAKPEACTAAVEGVLKAYRSIYIEEREKDRATRKNQLNEMKNIITAERDARRDAIKKSAMEYGFDDLGPLWNSKFNELDKTNNQISEYESKLLILNSQMESTGNQSVKKTPKDMTPEDIARTDSRMMNFLAARHDAESRMELLKKQGIGTKNKIYIEAESNYELRSKDVEDYARQWRSAFADDDPLASDPMGKAKMMIEKALKQERDRKTLLDDETKRIGTRKYEIEQLKEEMEERNIKLKDINKRIEELDMENKTEGRVEIMPQGRNRYSSRAMVQQDARYRYAAAGGAAGFFLAFGLVAMIGLVNSRFNYLDDARTTARLPLLGILPELPDDLADPEQASVASHCVHQIRTLLQIGREAEKRVFAVTSPASGAGKTSLTLALGVSFAAANSKTLIIDCDIVGGGLTARVETIIRRKIGQIFTKSGLISPQQLETALRLARNSQRKLGEILVDLNYLAPEDVDRALSMQDEIHVGLLDALAGEPIEDCVAETGIQGLSILPLGSAMPGDVSRLSPAAINNLLIRARERFDIVLVDTGPVPGSLEASTVATSADAVVLVVSRGEHRPMTEKSIKHLVDIGASIAGMVFNRARSQDMEFETTASRITSVNRSGRGQSMPRQADFNDPRFGPIASAVTGGSHNTKNPEKKS